MKHILVVSDAMFNSTAQLLYAYVLLHSKPQHHPIL